MSVTTVVVLHREPLVAEAIASCLGRFPHIASLGSGTGHPDDLAVRADVAVVHADIPEAGSIVAELARLGVRVVSFGRGAPISSEDDLTALACAVTPQALSNDGPSRLSSRERQVLNLAAKGLAGKQIATSLGISPKTVEQHKSRIFGKLGVPNQAAAVAAAFDRQVV
jgi:DNA-binding CsgD family transcriptional regulator